MAAADEVAGAVKAGARFLRQRVRYEFFGRQRRTTKIPKSEAVAAQAKFTRHPYRHRTQVAIEHPGFGIADRKTDRHRAVDLFDLVPGREGGAFGRPIKVLQVLRPVRQGQLHQLGLAAFTAKNQGAQFGQDFRAFLHELVEVGGGEQHHADTFPLDGFAKTCGGKQGFAVDADDAAAGKQGHPKIEGGRVERGIGGLADAVVRSELQIIGAEHQAGNAALADEGAFGATGRTRGEDHAGRPVAVDGQLRCYRGQARAVRQQWGDVFEGETNAARRQVLQQSVFGQQQRQIGVFDHAGQAFFGVGGIERHVSAAGLEDAEQADDQLGAAFEVKANELTGTDAFFAQKVGQAARAGIEFGVAEPAFAVNHGDGRRPSCGLTSEKCGQRGLARVFTAGNGNVFERCQLVLAEVFELRKSLLRMIDG